MVRIGLICALLPYVLLTDHHLPLAVVREAPPTTPLLDGDSNYNPVQLGESDHDGATVTLRYAFEDLPGVDRRILRPVALDAHNKHWVRTQFAHRRPLWFIICHGVVKLFAYKWVAGALFDYPELYLLSPAQWESILETFLVRKEEAPLHALDVGAGTGYVTSGFSALFDKVVATEVSRAYVWRLQQRSFEAHTTEVVSADSLAGQTNFDVVFALNVLDRHARPLRLLSEIAHVLRPGGAVVLSVPLPVTQHDSARYLPMLQTTPQSLGLKVGIATEDDDQPDATWEAAAAELVTQVIEPQGWRVVSVTRAPYMASGGRGQSAPITALDCVILVAVRAEVSDDALAVAEGSGGMEAGDYDKQEL
jgi:SAM-dependent methyltransferase